MKIRKTVLVSWLLLWLSTATVHGAELATNESKALRQLEVAEDLAKDRKFQEASIILHNIVALKPADNQTRTRIRNLAYAIVEAKPTESASHILLSRVCILTEDFDSAAAELDQAKRLAKDPTYSLPSDVLRDLEAGKQAHAKQLQSDLAKLELLGGLPNSSVQKIGSDAKSFRQLEVAEELANEGNFKAAMAVLEGIVKLEPKDSKTVGRIDALTAVLLKNNPLDCETHALVARLLILTERFEMAEAEIEISKRLAKTGDQQAAVQQVTHLLSTRAKRSDKSSPPSDSLVSFGESYRPVCVDVSTRLARHFVLPASMRNSFTGKLSSDAAPCTAVVNFFIERDGICSPKTKCILQSSGNKEFDLAALHAVEQAAPFLPTPSEFPIGLWSKTTFSSTGPSRVWTALYHPVAKFPCPDDKLINIISGKSRAEERSAGNGMPTTSTDTSSKIGSDLATKEWHQFPRNLSVAVYGHSGLTAKDFVERPADYKELPDIKIANDFKKEPVITPFLERLTESIKIYWHPPKQFESKRVIVRFRLRKDGLTAQASNVYISRSSGVALADNAALDAIKKTYFPMIPAALPETLDIEFTFDYNVLYRNAANPSAREQGKSKPQSLPQRPSAISSRTGNLSRRDKKN